MLRMRLSVAIALVFAMQVRANDNTFPPAIEIDMWIAEVNPPAEVAQFDAKANNDAAAITVAPDMKNDGNAWLKWAEKYHRIQPISRPTIRSQPNQQATIQVGTQVPRVTADGRITERDPNMVGSTLTVAVTPRISPKGLIVMELEVTRETTERWDGEDALIHQTTTAKTIVTAERGKTVILSGLKRFARTDDCSMIISLSPHEDAK